MSRPNVRGAITDEEPFRRKTWLPSKKRDEAFQRGESLFSLEEYEKERGL